MSIITNPETNQPPPPPHIVTFYKLVCPQCKTITVGDDIYDNWKQGQPVTCKCGYEAMPKTQVVNLNT